MRVRDRPPNSTNTTDASEKERQHRPPAKATESIERAKSHAEWIIIGELLNKFLAVLHLRDPRAVLILIPKIACRAAKNVTSAKRCWCMKWMLRSCDATPWAPRKGEVLIFLLPGDPGSALLPYQNVHQR